LRKLANLHQLLRPVFRNAPKEKKNFVRSKKKSLKLFLSKIERFWSEQSWTLDCNKKYHSYFFPLSWDLISVPPTPRAFITIQ
jgi:hypothetical protein